MARILVDRVYKMTIKLFFDNIVTVVDYGLHVYVFFFFCSVLLLCYSLCLSTVIGELKIIID